MRKTPVVLGVISIIFGALTSVLCLLDPLVTAATERLHAVNERMLRHGSELRRVEHEAMRAGFDVMRGYETASTLVYGIMAVALIVVGIGLYRRRPWARRATMAWAIVGLGVALAFCAYAIGWLQPQRVQAELAVYATHGITPPAHLNVARWRAITLFGFASQIAYPIVLMALIGRRSAARDFLPTS